MNTHPIDTITWLEPGELHPNAWNPNRVFKPELALLKQSLLLTGWIQPVLANANGMIIDGFHRWSLATLDGDVRAIGGGRIPVAVLDIDDLSAMLLTVRINRAKGSHASTRMSELVRALLAAGVTTERIMAEMGATRAEVELLAEEDVFKAKRVADWAYSPSWYPIEAESGTVPDAEVVPEVPEGVEVTPDGM